MGNGKMRSGLQAEFHQPHHLPRSFRNQRNDFKWEGLKLELDKTMFSHGTLYEVEVESVSVNAPCY